MCWSACIVGAAGARIPVILDGFITGAAALLAAGLVPAVASRCIAGHRSVEPGHAVVLERLGLRPLLELDLRLGEGTGAALAMSLVDAAVAIRDGMATFEQRRCRRTRRPEHCRLTMAEIILVRHAATSWSGVRYCGISDPPLSPTGLAEARRLAASLSRELPSDVRVVSSPSRRAVATASAIVDAARLAGAELDERWREADVGIAEGRTFDELQALAPDVAAALARGDLEIDWPGGETHASLRARIAAAWGDLLAVGRPTVVVTHAGPFMHALAIGRGPADLAR